MASDSLSKRIFSQANIYTTICLLFLIRHELFGSFSIMGRGLYVLYYLLTLLYFFRAITEFRIPKCLKILGVFFALVFIYGMVLTLQGEYELGSYFITIHLESMFPIFSFYYFAKKGLIDENWFRKVALLFFITAYIIFNAGEMDRLERSGADEVVNGTAYEWLALMPMMVFFRKKPVIQYIGIAIILFFVLSGFKRGAILLGAICFLVYLWHSLSSQKNSRRIIIVLLTGVLFYFLMQYLDNMMAASDLFKNRIDDTMNWNSSDRDDIYSKYWDYYWNQTSGIAFFFGNGALATVTNFGIMAHNDWLEYLIDMGLFGTIVYLILWISFIKMSVKSARICSRDVFMGILLILIINFGKSIFSMSISFMSVFTTSLYGYLIAQFDNNLNAIKSYEKN